MFIPMEWIGPIVIVTLAVIFILIIITFEQHQSIVRYLDWLQLDAVEVADYRAAANEAQKYEKEQSDECIEWMVAASNLADILLADHPSETKPHVKAKLLYDARTGNMAEVYGVVG